MTDDKPWLSLPDEEPPERGLAELMAAARVKAEVMAHPPWWKRVLEMMRRPPVLALATVVVLIGGVIVVGHHPEQEPPHAVQPEIAPAAPAGPAAAGSAAAVAAPPPVEEGEAPPPVESPKIESPKIESLKPVTHHTTKAPPPKNAVKADVDQVQQGEALELAPRTKGAEDKPSVLDSELARCRAAAANNDCTGARACAKDVEARDPAYYQANVAADPTLRPCL